MSSKHFKEAFGIIKDGVEDTHKSNEVSSNVVSVLQAGAFFGALGSAPLSGALLDHLARVRFGLTLLSSARWTEEHFVAVQLGVRRWRCAYTILYMRNTNLHGHQILTVVANGGSKGLSEIYAGRVISGFGIGGVSAVSPAYVSECAPKEIRGRVCVHSPPSTRSSS